VLPNALVREIDELVGKRGRSRFLADVAHREVVRLKQLKALQEVAGAWADQDHPELRDGAAQWIERLRAEDEPRFERLGSEE